MATRPRVLDFFGYFLVFVALSFPVQIMFLYGHSPLEIYTVIMKLTWLNWMVIGLLLINASLIQRASPWVRYLSPASVVLVALNNWIVGTWDTDYSSDLTSAASLGFVLAHIPLWQKKIRHLFVHPEHRWWLRPPRKKAELLTFVRPYNGASFKVKTFDLSSTGMFLAFDEVAPGLQRKLRPNDMLSLTFTLGGMSSIRCEARVVRKKDSMEGGYPPGLGLAFRGLSRHYERRLKKYIQAAAVGTPAA